MSTNANMYVTVDDLMHGSYRTSRDSFALSMGSSHFRRSTITTIP
jgi:hypothetical protein